METKHYTTEQEEQMVNEAYKVLRDGYLASNHRKKVEIIDRAFHFAKEAHKGIQRVEVIRARVDTAQHSGNVFLMLSYGDSTKEQIVVPMVCHDGVWYMK